MFWTHKGSQHGLSCQHECVYTGVGDSLEGYTRPSSDTSLAIAVHVAEVLLKRAVHLAKIFGPLQTAYGPAVGVGILSQEFWTWYCSGKYFVTSSCTCNLQLQRRGTQIRITVHWVSTPTECLGVILFPSVCMALSYCFMQSQQEQRNK